MTIPVIEFANSVFLWLLLIVPVAVWWLWFKKDRPTLRYSFAGGLAAIRPSWRLRLHPLLEISKLTALALFILGLARPQIKDTQSSITAEGIDIVMALDISRSMLIEDLGKLNRLDASKEVAEKFVQGRHSDRIGLVLFAGRSFTQCPLTVDYTMLVNLIRQVQIGMVEDGTAIGMGLVNAINRLRESKAKSKVIILLTDGDNNRGEIDPLTAAQIAEALGIRVYTIGAGKDGVARIPVDDPFWGRQYLTAEVKINEEPLRQIAAMTGGQFFRATNTQMLKDIYDQIGRLEKTKVEVKTYLRFEDLYIWFVMPAVLLLLLNVVLVRTVFAELP